MDFFALLGHLAADISELPTVGERCVVAGWHLGSEGRKHVSGIALFGVNGKPLAKAQATWIQVRS